MPFPSSLDLLHCSQFVSGLSLFKISVLLHFQEIHQLLNYSRFKRPSTALVTVSSAF